MRKFNSVDEIVNELKPIDPIYCIRPSSIKLACNWFKKNFPGQILYAVKTNPNETVINEIKNSEINKFDIASIEEIKIIKKIAPNAECFYMNTIKSREHIREAYFKYNIKNICKHFWSLSKSKFLAKFWQLAISGSQACALSVQILSFGLNQEVSSKLPTLMETISGMWSIFSSTGAPQFGQKLISNLLPLSPAYS